MSHDKALYKSNYTTLLYFTLLYLSNGLLADTSTISSVYNDHWLSRTSV